MANGKKKMSETEARKKHYQTSAFRQGYGRIKESKHAKRSARAVGTGLGIGGEGRVAGSRGTRGVQDRGNTISIVREKGASEIKKKGVMGGSKLKKKGRLTKSMSGKLQHTSKPKAKTVSAIKKKGGNMGANFSGAYGGKK